MRILTKSYMLNKTTKYKAIEVGREKEEGESN